MPYLLESEGPAYAMKSRSLPNRCWEACLVLIIAETSVPYALC